MSEIDLDLLASFLAVVEHGRIAEAARATHLSQPAVSARIRRLESQVDATLFQRSAQGVTPTPAGEKLARHAQEILRMLDRAAEDVRESESVGPLSLAASTTIAAQVLPHTLAAYQRRHPDVELRLQIGNTHEVADAVRSGRVPLALVEGNRRIPAIRLEPWVDDDLQLVVGRDAPKHWRPRSPQDLEHIPLLWRESGSGTRAVIAKALRAAGARSKPQAQDLVLGSNEAITSGVAAGLGLAFLSRWSLAPHLGAGRVSVVPGFSLSVQRTFHFAIPSGGLSGTAAHFMEFARRTPPRVS
ncbi:MAG: LysR substrate-binding domain-containing protein [Planctomycetota bacterium]